MNFSFDWKTNAIAIIRLNNCWFCGRAVVYIRLCFSYIFKVTFQEIKAKTRRIMKNLSASTSPLNNSFSAMDEMLSEAQVIAWSCALASEAVVIVLGNLLTIVLFTFNRKLRNKKRLYLVINMAFADLVLGGASLPLFVYFMVTRSRLYFSEFPSFLKIIFMVSSVASFTTAALISAERFYAIFWPLKHRTLSTRAYKLVILMAWILPILFSTAYILLFRLSLRGFFAFSTLYSLFLIVTICGLSIIIWRKIQQKSVPCHQNRDTQIRRLTKTLSLVSVVTLSTMIPAIILNLLRIFGQKISSNTLVFTYFIYFSRSFINPMMYALRMPEFRQGLHLFCFRSQENINAGRNNMAADHNNLKLTFKQEVMEATKLWLRSGGNSRNWDLTVPGRGQVSPALPSLHFLYEC